MTEVSAKQYILYEICTALSNYIRSCLAWFRRVTPNIKRREPCDMHSRSVLWVSLGSCRSTKWSSQALGSEELNARPNASDTDVSISPKDVTFGPFPIVVIMWSEWNYWKLWEKFTVISLNANILLAFDKTGIETMEISKTLFTMNVAPNGPQQISHWICQVVDPETFIFFAVPDRWPRSYGSFPIFVYSVYPTGLGGRSSRWLCSWCSPRRLYGNVLRGTEVLDRLLSEISIVISLNAKLSVVFETNRNRVSRSNRLNFFMGKRRYG